MSGVEPRVFDYGDRDEMKKLVKECLEEFFGDQLKSAGAASVGDYFKSEMDGAFKDVDPEEVLKQADAKGALSRQQRRAMERTLRKRKKARG